jgi:hypothetical protein
MFSPDETRDKRLWYGLKARVTIGPGFSHKSGIGRLEIPHPPLANWLLRRGLPDHSRRDLTFAHEFAHLQMAPIVLIYVIAMAVIAHARGRTSIGAVLLILSGIHAAWEIASEGLLMLSDPATYRSSYKGIARSTRTLFWSAGLLFAVAGWLVLLG